MTYPHLNIISCCTWQLLQEQWRFVKRAVDVGWSAPFHTLLKVGCYHDPPFPTGPNRGANVIPQGC